MEKNFLSAAENIFKNEPQFFKKNFKKLIHELNNLQIPKLDEIFTEVDGDFRKNIFIFLKQKLTEKFEKEQDPGKKEEIKNLILELQNLEKTNPKLEKVNINSDIANNKLMTRLLPLFTYFVLHNYIPVNELIAYFSAFAIGLSGGQIEQKMNLGDLKRKIYETAFQFLKKYLAEMQNTKNSVSEILSDEKILTADKIENLFEQIFAHKMGKTFFEIEQIFSAAGISGFNSKIEKTKMNEKVIFIEKSETEKGKYLTIKNGGQKIWIEKSKKDGQNIFYASFDNPIAEQMETKKSNITGTGENIIPFIKAFFPNLSESDFIKISNYLLKGEKQFVNFS